MEGIFDLMYMNHPANKHDERAEENRGRKNTTKRAGPYVQGMVKTKLEVVRIENALLCPHICSLHFAITVECPRLKQKKLIYNQPN